jgi:ATP-binding cassette subfamily C protein
LRFAAADGFVSRLPQGIHTPVGDRGVRLSGGERQRIVLARAILRKPRLLILDEATSALDSESEAAILDSLERLRGSVTIIVIAHRLSTIRGADQVVVMEQGRIVQCGRYAALAADRNGPFDRLLRQQATGV